MSDLKNTPEGNPPFACRSAPFFVGQKSSVRPA